MKLKKVIILMMRFLIVILIKKEMSKPGLNVYIEKKLKMWETMCSIQEIFPDAVFYPETVILLP